jgi:hypothetical protein
MDHGNPCIQWVNHNGMNETAWVDYLLAECRVRNCVFASLDGSLKSSFFGERTLSECEINLLDVIGPVAISLPPFGIPEKQIKKTDAEQSYYFMN